MTTAQAPPPSTKLEYNAWAYPWYAPHGTSPYDYMLAEGGRGSSKTYEISQAIAVKGHWRPLRIVVAREHLKSIDESAKPEIEERIRRLGLHRPDCYRFSRTSIDHANGTHIFFIGLSRLSEEDIKGLAMVDIVWVEEAHRMSHASWDLLRPTIRKDFAQIWATWNNKFRTDAIAKFMLESKDDPLVYHQTVNWRDNAYFTKRNNRDRLRYKKNNPNRYEHFWEGAFDDLSDKQKVLPYALLMVCVDAWDKRPKPRGAFVSAGLDVADTGEDQNSLTLRAGPEMFHVDRWHGSLEFTTSHTARKAGHKAMQEGASRFTYDAVGVGSGIRGPLMEMNPTFTINAAQFGGKVQGEDVPFIRGRSMKTNGQYFFNWAAQAGWALRMRAEMTARLMAGEDDVDPHLCLFIDPSIPNLRDVLAQLAQPEYTDASGKLKIDKQPRDPGEPEPPSPDAYDSAILAFSDDARRGLVART